MFNRIEDGMYWDRAWKLVEGCTRVSDGCEHCWSARETHMRAKNPNGKISSRNRQLTTPDGVFNGTVRLRDDNLSLPLNVKPATAFSIWNDLFHEDVPESFIRAAFQNMAVARHHLYFVLTKRAERMKDILCEWQRSGLTLRDGHGSVLPNVWLGVTAENQEQADKRIPLLRQTPAARRYVSGEPMLGPVDLRISSFNGADSFSAMGGIDLVICGGESGPGARPMYPDWARSLRDQCRAAGVPLFFKQWGEWAPLELHLDRKIASSTVCHWSGPAHPSDRGLWINGPGTLPNTMIKVGITAAGRTLDGEEYLQLPSV